VASIAKVVLIGNIGREPEWKQVGVSRILEIGVAYNRWWKKKDGAPLPAVWFRVTLWPSKKTDAIANILRAGMAVHVMGDLDIDEKDGKVYYSLRNAELTPLIGQRVGAEIGAALPPRPEAVAPAAPAAKPRRRRGSAAGEDDF
jgi:hypothetical protein